MSKRNYFHSSLFFLKQKSLFRTQSKPPRFRSISPTDNKLRVQALLRKYLPYPSSIVEPISADIRSSMDALLDAVEALKTISNVQTEAPIQTSEQPSRTKKPRKSNLQHRILPKPPQSEFLTCPSLDLCLTQSFPFVPLRPLSVSPPPEYVSRSICLATIASSSVELFESIPSEINEDHTRQLNVKSEEDEQQQESTISDDSFLIPPSLNVTVPLPTIIPSIPEMLPQNIWPSVLSIHSPTQPSKTTKSKRSKPSSQNRVNDHTHLVSNTPSLTIQDSIEVN